MIPPANPNFEQRFVRAVETRDWHATDQCIAALTLDVPRTPTLHFYRALVHCRDDEFSMALDELEAAFALANDADPIHPDFFVTYGEVCQRLKKWIEAEQALLIALGKMPSNPRRLVALGNLYRALNKPEEAEPCFRAALAIPDLTSDEYVSVIEGYAMIEISRGYGANVENRLRQAIEILPSDVRLLATLYLCLSSLERYAEAETIARQVLMLDPEDVRTHLNLSFYLLMQGKYDEGWREAEYRLRLPDAGQRHGNIQRWDGESLIGKTILVWHEQGLGDNIQFCRYLTDLKKRGAIVVYEVQKPLVKLLASVSGIDEIISTGETPVTHPDYQVPLLSLPSLLYPRNFSIELRQSYLSAESKEVTRFRKEFAMHAYTGKKLVGLCWTGNAEYASNHLRSIDPMALLPLAGVSNVVFYNLLRGFGDLDALRSDHPVSRHFRLNDPLPEARGFADAALIAALDLVITVDTSVAHLAGALGCPTWLMLQFAPDCRWGQSGVTTPWYPAMRLFRQSAPNDWDPVVDEVLQELVNFVNQE